MQITLIDSLIPATGGAPVFQGTEHGANASFFVSHAGPGKGASAHRHPYEEIFVVLDGRIEATVDGETATVTGGNVVVIPATAWHEFVNTGTEPVTMVNIHPVAEMVTEWRDEPS
jgi:quercetin dioxygenase-like cupin family protein